jgi:hypothetical protein
MSLLCYKTDMISMSSECRKQQHSVNLAAGLRVVSETLQLSVLGGAGKLHRPQLIGMHAATYVSISCSCLFLRNALTLLQEVLALRVTFT